MLPEFAFQIDFVVGLSVTQAKVQPKSVTALNNVEYILEFEEGTQMVAMKRSLKQIKNWLGMLVKL